MASHEERQRIHYRGFSLLLLFVILALSIAIVVLAVISSSRSKEASSDKQKTKIECDVAVIGGGISGLFVAEVLGRNRKEEKICLFERNDRFGGRIWDYTFKRFPNFTVGLGAYRFKKNHKLTWQLGERLQLRYEPFKVSPRLFKARGVESSSREEIRKKAYPSTTVGKFKQFSVKSAEAFVESSLNATGVDDDYASHILHLLSSEWLNFFKAVTGSKNYFNPLLSAAYVADSAKRRRSKPSYFSPAGGMSQFIDGLVKSARKQPGVKLYLNNEVQILNYGQDLGNSYAMVTKKFEVQAQKVVIAVPPTPFSKMKGSIPSILRNHSEAQTTYPNPLFKAFLIYETAWWEKAKIGKQTLRPLQWYTVDVGYLGTIIALPERGPNGEALLWASYGDYENALQWGTLLKEVPNSMDRRIQLALNDTFADVDVPEALDSVYQFWEEGGIHDNKVGTNVSLTDISNWAKRPLPGKEIHLVGEAYGLSRHWCEGALETAVNVLKEGWALKDHDI